MRRLGITFETFFAFCVALTFTVLGTVCMGQQQAPSEQEMSGRLNMLQAQRDEANNRLVLISGRVTELQTQLDAARKEADACKQPDKKPK